MLVGAFASFTAGLTSGSPALALTAGAGAGLLGGALFALVAIAARADPILVGAAWNLLAFGGTAFGYRLVAGETGAFLQVPTLRAAALGVPPAALAVFLLPLILHAGPRFTRPGLIEEYSVSVDGVRQDFVVLEPPPLNSQPSTLNESEVKIIKDITGRRTSEGTTQDFVNLFRERYQTIRKILCNQRREIVQYIPMNRIRKTMTDVQLIGIVKNVKKTHNGHR